MSQLNNGREEVGGGDEQFPGLRARPVTWEIVGVLGVVLPQCDTTRRAQIRAICLFLIGRGLSRFVDCVIKLLLKDTNGCMICGRDTSYITRLGHKPRL